MIKNLIFDFGKVLVDYDFERFFKTYIPDDDRRKAFSPILFNEHIMRVIDREQKPFEETMSDLIHQNPEFENEIRIFDTHYPEIVTGEFPGMKDLLSRLKAEGYHLYGLSNWCSKVYLTIRQYDIFSLLDGYVISSEEHLIKPDADIYQRLFDKFNLSPAECIFTDDKPENIEGSERVGMRAILFHDAAQYESDLRKLL